MTQSIPNLKIINFQNSLVNNSSNLETEYSRLYGSEFVKDLKTAYDWMLKDFRTQHLKPEAILRRRKRYAVLKPKKFFFVDFDCNKLVIETIDEFGGKTIHKCNTSILEPNVTNNNLRYLLSGIYLFNKNKAQKWTAELLGEGQKFWYAE